MTVYIVMTIDRHTDPEPEPFTNPDAAIAYARRQAEECSRDGAYDEQPSPEGWLFYATYGPEGDSVWVLPKELRET